MYIRNIYHHACIVHTFKNPSRGWGMVGVLNYFVYSIVYSISTLDLYRFFFSKNILASEHFLSFSYEKMCVNTL